MRKAIWSSNPRIRDEKAKQIIDTLGVDVSKYDPFMSHEGVVARTIMFANTLRGKLFAATIGRKLNNRIALFKW